MCVLLCALCFVTLLALPVIRSAGLRRRASSTRAYDMSNDELREMMLDLAAASLDEGVVSFSPKPARVRQSTLSPVHDLDLPGRADE